MPDQPSAFRPYTRPKDGPRRPMLGYTFAAWWFNISHWPGSLLRRLMRPVWRVLNPSPAAGSSLWTGLLALGLVIAATAGVTALVMLRPKHVSHAQGVNHEAVGVALSEWELASLNQPGATAKSFQMEGKVTVLHFWRLDHKHSLETLPKIAQVHQRFRGSNVYGTLAVVVPPGRKEGRTDEDLEGTALRRKVMDLLSQQNIDLPVYADQSGAIEETVRAVGAFAGRCPTTIVLDKTGKIEGVWNEYALGQSEQISALVQHLTTR